MVIALLVMAVVFILVLYLQNVLSKSRHKWAGYVLPVVFFLISFVFSFPNFKTAFSGQFSIRTFIASLVIFLIYNTVTAILLAINWGKLDLSKK